MLFALLIEPILIRSEILAGSSKLGVAKISCKHSKALSVLRSRNPVETSSYSFLSRRSVWSAELQYLSILTSRPLVQFKILLLNASYL